MDSSKIYFKRVTADTVLQICKLSETLSPVQRTMVADNSISIAQAHFSECAWFRAIYLDKKPIGFIMTHTGSDYDDGIDVPGIFLWRLMIAKEYQGSGYGKKAIELLVQHLKANGVNQLSTSCEVGDGSPEGFYRRLGFIPDGSMYGDEIGLILKF